MGLDLSQIQGTGSDGLITVNDVANLAQKMQDQATDAVRRTLGQATSQADGAVGQATGGDGSGEPRATNAAQRKAEELGVDLSNVAGSGPDGRITLYDVKSAVQR